MTTKCGLKGDKSRFQLGERESAACSPNIGPLIAIAYLKPDHNNDRFRVNDDKSRYGPSQARFTVNPSATKSGSALEFTPCLVSQPPCPGNIFFVPGFLRRLDEFCYRFLTVQSFNWIKLRQ